jgi:hypothetical protein
MAVEDVLEATDQTNDVEMPNEISSEAKKSVNFSAEGIREGVMEIVNDEIEQIFLNGHVNRRFEDVTALSARISSKRG